MFRLIPEVVFSSLAPLRCQTSTDAVADAEVELASDRLD
jgi:hypothetical protein